MSSVYKIAVLAPDLGVTREAVGTFLSRLNGLNTTVITSSTCKPVIELCEERGLRCVPIRANRKKYGAGAAGRRAKEIAAAADDVAVFWNAADQGHRGVFIERQILAAVKAQKRVAIFGVDGDLIRSVEPGEIYRPTMVTGIPRRKRQGPLSASSKKPARLERHRTRTLAHVRRRADRKPSPIEQRLGREGVWLPDA